MHTDTATATTGIDTAAPIDALNRYLSRAASVPTCTASPCDVSIRRNDRDYTSIVLKAPILMNDRMGDLSIEYYRQADAELGTAERVIVRVKDGDLELIGGVSAFDNSDPYGWGAAFKDGIYAETIERLHRNATRRSIMTNVALAVIAAALKDATASSMPGIWSNAPTIESDDLRWDD